MNTLLLAYAGASMPLLLVFAVSSQPLGVVANSEIVAVEIVRTLCGSIGLVAAVPVTTFMAAVLVGTQSSSDPAPITDAGADEMAAEAANQPATTTSVDGPEVDPAAETAPAPTEPPAAAKPERNRPTPSWDDFGPLEN